MSAHIVLLGAAIFGSQIRPDWYEWGSNQWTVQGPPPVLPKPAKMLPKIGKEYLPKHKRR
ncbi:MAG: hypothetical protein HYV68_03745 [Candidatus Taylorbacteria bacterium]|nr:hypothetical protein [Candidatus Taylorbacteria bacterium]